MTPPFLFFVGIDWGSTTHHAFACWTRTVRFAAAGPFPTGARAKRSLSAGSWTRPGPRPGRSRWPSRRPTARSSKGLLLAGFAVLAIGPAQIRGSRRRYVSSGAKDDPRDAWMLGRALRADPDLFRQLALEEPLVLQLRERTRTVNELTCQRTRLCHQIRQQLWRYYPQLLAIPDLLNQLTHPWFRRALEQGQNARTGPQAAPLHPRQTPQKVRHPPTERRKACGRSCTRPALSVAPGTAEAAGRALAKPLRPGSHHQPTPRPGTRRHPRTAEGVLPDPRSTTNAPTTSPSSSPSPESGSTSSARLLAEAFDLLQRRDYPALRARSGVAPVSIQSGNTQWEIRRLAVQHELRNGLYHWARVAARPRPPQQSPLPRPPRPRLLPRPRPPHRRRPAPRRRLRHAQKRHPLRPQALPRQGRRLNHSSQEKGSSR